MSESNRLSLEKFGKNDWVFNYPTSYNDTFDEFYEALDLFQANNFEIAETIFSNIAKENIDHIDVFHYLSLLYANTSRELDAYVYCREACRIGLDALPKDFNWSKATLEWGHMENRPFLRAYHNLALYQESLGLIDDAITTLSRILSVNSNDNLGVRLILPKLWLKLDDIPALINHCKDWSDDYSPEIMYGHALALIISGDTKKAEPLLAEAKQEFPLVAKELLKKRHTKPKSDLEGYMSHGGPDQAYAYWQHYGEFWTNNKSAMSNLQKA